MQEGILQHSASRLLGLIPTLLVLITIAFFMIRMAPGGPFDSEKILPPEIKANLERLIASPEFDNTWETNLRADVQGLEPLPDSAAYLDAKRTEIAAILVEHSESLLAQERFDLADKWLTSSVWFVEEYAPADQLRQELVAAKGTFDSANKETELKAQVDGLKRSFATELNAERIPEARNTLSRLQQLLPGGDSFITGEAPQMLADTYSTMATRALSEGRFDHAVRFRHQRVVFLAGGGSVLHGIPLEYRARPGHEFQCVVEVHQAIIVDVATLVSGHGG